MIRIAHTSDLHIDERGRLDDNIAVLDAFLAQAVEAEVDLFVLAGDLFERRSTPAERNALAAFLQEAASIAPVFGVKGNHDAAQDLAIFNRLETDDFIWIADKPTLMPGSAPIWLAHGKRLGLLALPWFDKAHLVATLEATVDAEASRQLTIAAAKNLLTCLRAEAQRIRREGAVPILAAHIQVAGSTVASGQTLIGTSVELSPADILDVDAAYAALGHIHFAQEWFEGRVAYSGSPNRCNFGEPETKGWRLVTLADDGDFVSNEVRELPARRMVLIESDWTGAGAGDLDQEGISWSSDVKVHELRDALVRFRYRIRAQDLSRVNEARLREALAAAGAHEVRIEAVIETETRVRAAEISTITSTVEKVDAFLRAKAIDVDEGHRTRLHTKVEELEGSCA